MTEEQLDKERSGMQPNQIEKEEDVVVVEIDSGEFEKLVSTLELFKNKN